MPSYIFGNFLLYCVINAITPGPGNLLALNTATQYGWKRGKKLYFGIFAGYYVVQIICAFIVYGLLSIFPQLMTAMKYIGAAYIIWLAIHIVKAIPGEENSQQEASFFKGYILQFVNVKIYMFGITALTSYIVAYSTSLTSLLFFEVLIATMGTLATSLWIFMGVIIQRWYKKYYKTINFILALTLLECVYSIIR